MKRILSILMTVILCLGFCTAALSEESDYWKVKYVVDEFKELTGEKYIAGGPFSGTFSNSAEKDAVLSAYVIYDGENIIIRLYEYETLIHSNIFSESAKYTISIKADTYNYVNEEYSSRHVFYCKGFIPGYSSDLIIQSGSNSDFYSDTYSMNFEAIDIDGSKYTKCDDILGRSRKILVSIKGVKSLEEYFFTIPDSTGFATLAKEVFGKKYKETLPDPAEKGVVVGTGIINQDGKKGTVTKIFTMNAISETSADMKPYTVIEVQFADGSVSTFALDLALSAGTIKIK